MFTTNVSVVEDAGCAACDGAEDVGEDGSRGSDRRDSGERDSVEEDSGVDRVGVESGVCCSGILVLGTLCGVLGSRTLRVARRW